MIVKIDGIEYTLDVDSAISRGILKQRTFHIGQRFKLENSIFEYLLCQVEARKLCLVDIVYGNRFRDPIYVNNPFEVTRTELLATGCGQFKLVE